MFKESRTKNSVLNLLTSVGGQMLLILLKFITRTVFIQTLGKAYLGINGLFADILSMLSLTELGIDTAINFQLYKPLAEHDDKRVRVLMKFYRQAYRVIGAVILLLGLCLIPMLPHLIRDYDSLTALKINATLLFLLFLMQSVSSYWFFAYRSAVMKANQKKYILDVADYAVTIVSNIAQILVLTYVRSFMLYTAVLLAFTVIKNLVNASISEHLFPQFFQKEDDSLSREEVVGLFKDCGAVFVYKVNGVVLKATDNIVLSKFIGLALVGVYSNYLLFSNTIRSLLYQVYTAVKASMGNLFVLSDISKKYQFFQIMNFLTIVLYGTAAVGVAVCADELICVWISENYVIPQPFSILVGAEILFQGLMNNLGQIRGVSGTFRQMWYRPIIGIFINIILSVWLVQVCGIYGVLIGTIVSILLTNILMDPILIHKYAFENYKPASEYYKRNLMYLIVLAVICAVEMWLCSVLLPGRGWLSAIVHIIVVAFTVPTCLIGIFWRTQERKYLMKVARLMAQKIIRRLSH